MKDDIFLSPTQAAAYLNCTLSKIRKDIYRKDLEFVKIGRLVRISKNHLDDLIKANTHARRTDETEEGEKGSA